MCGIHIIIDKQSSLSQTPVRQMQKALQHRGPDAASNIAEIRTPRQAVFMALNRLRITDLRPDADQLFQSADGRYTLAYNGAIYNYLEIRRSLEAQYVFRTNTDTEVLFYLLLDKGAAGLENVNGMFAFAWYDREQEKLLLCRDRFGMKPLYYAETEKYIIVSSEIKGILASGLLKKELNLSQIPHYMAFKFAQRPFTFYQDIFELMPGRLYTASPAKALSSEAVLPSFKTIITEPVTTKQIEHILLASLERHIKADVPVGLFLSGGVDSTLLLAMTRELGITHLPVFNIANSTDDASFGTRDYHFAQLAARQYGADYHPVQISSGLIKDFSDFITRIDQPVADGAAWLTLLLAQEAKSYTTVVLSGAGADELFAGYYRHWAYYKYLQHYKPIMQMLPLLKKMPAWLPTGFRHPLRKQFRLLRKMALQTEASPEQTFINFTALLQPRQTADCTLSPSEFTFPPPDPSNYLKKALCYDQAHFLSADVLALTDRMTMQAGIEARLPYLDAQLVTTMEAVNASFLLENGRKWILNEFLAKREGKPYIQRPKEGFGMPFGKWLKTKKACYLINLLKNNNSAIYEVLLYEDVMQILQSHLTGKVDYSSELWALVLLAAWVEKEFGTGHQ